MADQLLTDIVNAGAGGLDRQAQHAAFGRNVTATRLTAARTALVNRKLVRLVVEKTPGRDREVAVAAQFANQDTPSRPPTLAPPAGSVPASSPAATAT